MLLGLVLAALIGTRQIYLVNHHPVWEVEGVRWAEKNGYRFVAVYVPETDTPKTIIVDRGQCQCVSRPYWDSVYRRGEWVDIPILADNIGDKDMLVTIYVVNSGQFPKPSDAVVSNIKLSELPKIEYVNVPFYKPSRRRIAKE